jgi:hypothetical protein
MKTASTRRRFALAMALMAGWLPAAFGADIGQVKTAKGPVAIERGGQTLPVAIGMRVQTSDVVKTGADASVGITMIDDTLLSAGPNSTLALDRCEYDPTTSKGKFDTSLRTGSLAVVSGRIAKQSPEAMTVRTPFAVLGVRGTEFVVETHEPVLATR